nr:1,2-phenylacetyl-CoA epoxidase subunit PaaC [Bacillus kwashiorkori]
MNEKIKSATEVQQNKEYKEALTELLYQLADDDFILSFRGSEWLGLAPHIEEDVAFSSITQNMMGHAFMYYQLLEELGEGDIDYLAHSRPSDARKNAILLEEANGNGTYLTNPNFDWAFTVVRHYFYDMYKRIKLLSLKNSSYGPLSEAAINIRMEHYYHIMHWQTWFKQLISAGGEAKTRMCKAIDRVYEEIEGLLTLGPNAKKMTVFGLIEEEDVLKQRFYNEINEVFEELQLERPAKGEMKRGNGRIGEHTEDLNTALLLLSDVYRSIPNAVW